MAPLSKQVYAVGDKKIKTTSQADAERLYQKDFGPLPAPTSSVGSTTLNSNNLKDSKPFNITPAAPLSEAAGLSAMTETRSKSIAEDIAAGTFNSKSLGTRAVEAEQGKNTSLAEYLKASTETKGKTQLEDEAYSVKGGVDETEGELKEINQQILEEQNSRRRKLEALEKNPEGRLRGALSDIKDNIERESIAKEADLTIIQLGRLGKYDSAKAVADRAVAVQLEKDKAKIDALRVNYEDNKDLFTTAEQRAFETAQNEREEEFSSRESELKTVKEFALKALELGAPMSTVQSMLSATSIDDALALGGSYVAPAGAGSPEDMAYAAQYASTGQIPTGVKGAQFGRIAELAKQIPKPKGTIVDAQTGVKSTTVGQAEQSDFGALQNIIENSKRLKALDAQRSQGLVGGSLSKVFGGVVDALGGDNTEAEYLTVRKAIIDDIARMQTGAALTKEEQDFYNEYLPGRFSQAFFLGERSSSKIDNFISVMNDRFNTRMGAYGLSSYGYSEVVAPDGNTYKVGDTIRNANGVSGTVLPDGTVSVPDEEAAAGEVSVSIPAKSRLAYVNNNPGNLRFVGQPGATKGEGGFAKFESPEAGAAALSRQVALDVSRGNTLDSFINKYAPPSENNTAQYIAQAQKALGIAPSTKLTKEHVAALTRFMAKKESSSTIA